MDFDQSGAGSNTIDLLRKWILGVLVLGLLGTVTELVLLSHYEQPLQLVPVGLIILALAVLIWHVMRNDAASLHTLLIVMALFIVSGFAGFAAHFHGSAEFQLDLDPAMSSWQLVQKVLRAKAPPFLAPGMMIQLGLLGLAYVFSDSRYRIRALRIFGAALPSRRQT